MVTEDDNLAWDELPYSIYWRSAPRLYSLERPFFLKLSNKNLTKKLRLSLVNALIQNYFILNDAQVEEIPRKIHTSAPKAKGGTVSPWCKASAVPMPCISPKEVSWGWGFASVRLT